MSETEFDREAMAAWYAERHLEVDPGTQVVYHLASPDPREIRFVEVNTLMAERDADPYDPYDFGVDPSSPNGHRLLVVDLTPSQYDRVRRGEVSLPPGWTLDCAAEFRRPS